MKHRWIVTVTLGMLLLTSLAWVVLGTDAEIYLASDKNGQNRVTNLQEGDEVYIVVYDPDENIDCDVRDKFWTDIKIMDPKTGAYINWMSLPATDPDDDTVPMTEELGWLLYLYGQADDLFWDEGLDVPLPHRGHSPGNTAGSTLFDYMEETGADTGLFVSKRSFQIGARVDWNNCEDHAHVVDNTYDPLMGMYPTQFHGGGFGYWFGAARGMIMAMGIDDPDDLEYLFPWYLDIEDQYWWRIAPSVLPPPWLEDEGEGEFPEYLYVRGHFENMDTLVVMYQDQNDTTDVAVGMAKIDDHEATLSWDQEIYKDANTSATITVVDPDENLNCNEVEYVPVFIIVNPGSWNPLYTWDEGDDEATISPTNFCSLKTFGGVNPDWLFDGPRGTDIAHAWADYMFDGETIRWYNIYNSGLPPFELENGQPSREGAYYMQYPKANLHDNVTYFDTGNEFGLCRVSFCAQETGVNTGVFQLNINSLLDDLGFNSLRVRDVLVAYYLDPNDEDDFKIATAYIEEWNHSLVSFTDADRNDQEEYWLGRDPIYIQVIDANANVDPCCPEQVVVHLCDVHNEDDFEWFILDETSSNSPVFFTFAGYELRPVWDALGIGETVMSLIGVGGFQLWPDNWKVEAYNEDDIYVRYNDQYYTSDVIEPFNTDAAAGQDLSGVGDANPFTAMPPWIDRTRVANDISFDMIHIGDTQVYDGQTAKMYFLDRQGNRVSGYVNSDCIFIEVIDPDQDEDQRRRERVDAWWDGGQNWPFGPMPLNDFVCEEYERYYWHPANWLLGDTNIFGDEPYPFYIDGDIQEPNGSFYPSPQVYVLNPRSGFWAALDLMENGVASGDFVSVICVDLTSVYECVPTLGALPGDTIIAVYKDPSNHSDSCWISIKVGIGGGGTPPSQASSTMFVDETGADVGSYTDADTIYVKVIDPSHAGAAALLDAVEIAGDTYDLEPLAGATSDTFITEGLALDLVAGEDITATYTDPTDPTDTSSDTVSIVASVLDVTGFTVTPNPFEDEVTFGYEGTGVAQVFQVDVYDVAGDLVWSAEEENVTEVMWDGAGAAKGAYIYIITVTDGTETFSGRDVFVKK